MQSSREPMTERALAGIINKQIEDAVAYDASELAKDRQKALRYYEGHKTLDDDVDVQEGRSSVVSRDTSDTHGWVLPGLQRVFAAGERVVSYEARRPEAEDGATQASDYVNYVFRTECDGYSALYSALWEGLLLGNGIIKHWWDSTPEYCTQTLSGISEAKYIETVNDPNVEVLEHSERDDPNDYAVAPGGGMDGALAPPAGGAAPVAGAPPGAETGADSAGAPGAAGAVPGTAELYTALPEGIPHQGEPGPGTAGTDIPGAMPGVAFAAPKLHDLKIKRKLYDGRVRIAAVPAEEFRINRDATKLDEEHVLFCGHVSHMRTRSALIQSYPAKRSIIDELPAYIVSATNDGGAKAARGQSTFTGVSPDHSTDLIEVWECYVQLDYDGDGVAEWRQVITAAGNETGPDGRAILANEEWGDPLPFSDVVPDPMPHRWRGRSLFDDVMDIQQVKTVFLRGFADNLYWVNNQREEVVVAQVYPESMKELYNPTFGGKIFVKQTGTVTPLPIPFIGDKLTIGLDWFDRIREFRTGVSAATAGLDPETLQNQTAMAASLADAASHAKNELRARNCAEGGIKRMFGCLLKLIVQHQDKARTIKLRGKWVPMNPNSWDADMDVIVNVGLGSGSRERDVALLQAVSMEQKAIIQGLTPMVAAQLGMGPDVVFATDRKMVEAAGLKSPEIYFPEISSADVKRLMQEMQQQQQGQQDPKMVEVNAKIAADQQRMQAEDQARKEQAALDWQHRESEFTQDSQHKEREIELKGQAAIRDIELKQQAAEATAARKHDLDLQQIEANKWLKKYELDGEFQLKRLQIEMQPKTQPNVQQTSE